VLPNAKPPLTVFVEGLYNASSTYDRYRPDFLLASLTTAKMGQYWKILDIDRRERLPNKKGLKLWEIVHNDTAQQLVQFLARPTFLQCSELLDQESADETRSATTSTGPAGSIGYFAKLPSELFIILSGFLADVDAILLGLTCRTMWLKTCARVQRGCTPSKHADWGRGD
jgi:hypothetical protein